MFCESIDRVGGGGEAGRQLRTRKTASLGSEQEQPLAILQSRVQTLGVEQTAERGQKNCQGYMVSSANTDTPLPSRGGHNACTGFSHLMFLSRASLP